MKDKEIVEISITSLVVGSNLRGQFEEKIKEVADFCKENPDITIFIDEIHMIVGARGEKGVSDAANILKPALARGQLRCIGATTLWESQQFLKKDKALKRRFQPVMINESSVEQTIEILDKSKKTFEDFHEVSITDDAIGIAAELTDKYVKDRFFSGKAIDLLDQTSASERINSESNKIVDAEKVASVIAKDAQVPITQLLPGRNEELSLLGSRFRELVIGQDEAIKSIEGVIHLTKLGMDMNPKGPEGVFPLAGPTGVGKTELARFLAKAFLDDEDRLVALDMTEFKDRTSVPRLIGAAPGHVGFEQESLLVKTVRSYPNSIILMARSKKRIPMSWPF